MRICTHVLLPNKNTTNSRNTFITLLAVFSGLSDSRRLLYLSSNADSNSGDQRDRHYAEYREWLKDHYDEYGKTNIFFR